MNQDHDFPVDRNEHATPQPERENRQPHRSPELYVALRPNASFKIGTCEHCVLSEEGRPARAWDAEGDKELDFDRDTYFACLARFGLVIHERQAYVCP